MHELTTLDNGLRVLTVTLPHVQSVSLGFFMAVGSRFESQELSGASHFIEHMLFKGTRRWPTARDVAEAIDGRGGMFNASTGLETTLYWAKVAAADVPQALDVLSDMLLQPTFDPAEMEKERTVIAEDVVGATDDAVDILVVAGVIGECESANVVEDRGIPVRPGTLDLEPDGFVVAVDIRNRSGLCRANNEVGIGRIDHAQFNRPAIAADVIGDGTVGLVPGVLHLGDQGRQLTGNRRPRGAQPIAIQCLRQEWKRTATRSRRSPPPRGSARQPRSPPAWARYSRWPEDRNRSPRE